MHFRHQKPQWPSWSSLTSVSKDVCWRYFILPILPTVQSPHYDMHRFFPVAPCDGDKYANQTTTYIKTHSMIPAKRTSMSRIFTDKQRKLDINLAEVDERLNCALHSTTTEPIGQKTSRKCAWEANRNEMLDANNERKKTFTTYNRAPDENAPSPTECN